MQRLAGRIILLSGWRRAATAFLAGALLVLAQAPYDFFAVGFVSFPILVWLIDGASPEVGAGPIGRLRPTFAIGWWFGFGYFLAGLWWIGSAVLVEAETYAWALPLAVLGIPLLLAFFYGFAAALARLLWSDGIGRIAALAFAFGFTEWLRTFLFTGFPWNAVGYAAMPVPVLMQSASVVGLIGMNALGTFLFAMPALLSGDRDRRLGMAMALVLCTLHVGFGFYRLSQAPEQPRSTIAVRIVQPSVSMSEKWDAAFEDRVFAELMRSSGEPPAEGQKKPQLILWPETSVPFLFTDRPDALAALGAMLTDGQMLLAGAVRDEGVRSKSSEIYYNSVVAIDAGGEIVEAVDKIHLVPFGEYLPFAEWLAKIGIEQMVAGPMNFAAGAVRRAITLPGGLSAVPFICYEIIFPQLVDVDAASSDIIVNVTNDAWFGDTPSPYQHFRQAQVRSVETGMPLVRAANTGISGAVDAYGRIVDAFGVNARGYLDVELSVPRKAAHRSVNNEMVGLAMVFLMGVFAALGLVRARFT
ncbi:apolipoprotein N-acyltransferase [Pseudaminobacter sp. 19-2017]|uniref:Apolipoprotein N-acyltransferase n=1 Tax=Pseudaminobacter soli (ex Zhang et al. 2022) TaxID=2831468 RepID=A0A942IA90_9HYPH|nr:apolipoprotein N-acyltransferase [Pseudaminobacter soli]MBS3651110.1 apolipoprotein N-acyltransferase [Pseudaminobacter soli]